MEDEYNRWYNDQHVPDVLGVDGFVGVQRFKLSAAPGGPDPYWGYVAFYEIDRDKVDVAFKGLEAARGTPKMVMSEALNRADNETAVTAPVAEKVKDKAAPANRRYSGPPARARRGPAVIRLELELEAAAELTWRGKGGHQPVSFLGCCSRHNGRWSGSCPKARSAAP